MNHAVIMAGGIGSRFWPRSRKKKPKQVLNIFGSNTLLQETVARVSELIPPSEILIVTTAELTAHIRNQLPNLDKKNIIIEPVGKNTAPCIGLAALEIQKRDPEGIMVVLPADHLIADRKRFVKCLEQAINTAQQDDSLVTIGIMPTQPETGYGYIQFDPQVVGPHGAYGVKTFAEKPHLETAQRFESSVDTSPESSMITTGSMVQLGSRRWTTSRLTSAVFDTSHCRPAATKPSRESESGTRANRNAPRMNAPRTSDDFVANARCQNDWSPKGPARRPIVTGTPKLPATESPSP